MYSPSNLLVYSLIVKVAFGESAAERLAELPLVLEQEIDPIGTVANANSDGRNGASDCPALKGLRTLEKEAAISEFVFSVHRNGEAESCGSASLTTSDMELALRAIDGCNETLSKYHVETLLTTILTRHLTSGKCGSTDNATASESFAGFCDMGPKRTVIQADYPFLVRLSDGSLPCRFYTRDGQRIVSLEMFADLSRQAKKAASSCSEKEGVVCPPELQLYAVPAGRVFMFAPSFVGETFVLDRMRNNAPSNAPIVVEVLSLKPRIFELHNFFSLDEADTIIEQALSESSDSHKFHRSTTGAVDAQIFSRRTSENAWLTSTSEAVNIKRRCLEFLGFDEYRESHTDGLQVLRYQNNQAYAVHPDYLSDGPENYDYNTAGVGGNRFATILLYMSDVDSGGETVFDKVYAHNATPEQLGTSDSEVTRKLRESGEIDSLKAGSWEETLTAKCRTRLAVKPKRGRAVLFYSQHPNGVHDEFAMHGACPILNGTKWAANLWVWNAPRQEFEYAPRKRPEERAPRPVHNQLWAEFRNSGTNPGMIEAELYYNDDDFFGKLGPKEKPIQVNTYEGHKWNIKVNGKVQKTFEITSDARQFFEV